MRKNRKKELRNAFHKSYKGRPTILKGQTEAEYYKVVAEYDRQSDEFYVTIHSYIGGKYNIRIRGILDARYFYGRGRGILIKTPKHLRTRLYFNTYNCYEVFIKEEETPNLLMHLKAYVHTIGDMLDDNIYEDNTTYKLVMDDVDGTIKDSDIGNHLKWPNLTTTKIDT